MAFWGLELSPGKPLPLVIERRLVVKQAALVIERPRAEPARIVGGFRRLALVRGVSSSVRCAAVAMVALRAAGLRVEVRARAALGLRSRGRGRTSPQAQRRLPGLGAAF